MDLTKSAIHYNKIDPNGKATEFDVSEHIWITTRKDDVVTSSLRIISRNISRNINNPNDELLDDGNNILYVSENRDVVISITQSTKEFANHWNVVMIGGGFIYPEISFPYIPDNDDFVRSVMVDQIYFINNQCNTSSSKQLISMDNKRYFERLEFTTNYPTNNGVVLYYYRIVLVRNKGQLFIKYYPGNTEEEYTYQLNRIN
jgi:hypothetical protein